MAPPAEPVKGKASVDGPATLVVTLPADAKLTIDSTATTATSGRRVFASPTLKAGTDYVYTLKAEVMRDGSPVQVSKTVTVRANQETSVSLTLPTTATASR